MWWNTCSKGKDGGQEETNKLLTETEEDKNENVIAQRAFLGICSDQYYIPR